VEVAVVETCPVLRLRSPSMPKLSLEKRRRKI
jgi:hypothetical protein